MNNFLQHLKRKENKMKTIKTSRALNAILLIWIAGWIYYALFNWDIFIIGLNTNLGFTVMKCYPFLITFFTGLIALLFLKYLSTFNEMNKDNKISLYEKDLEIFKMKEVLFRMQNPDVGKSASNLNALYDKLDELSDQIKTNSDDTTNTNDVDLK